MTNPNIVYSKILVDELARSGLKHVCLTPGSRNTPLVLAFAKHPSIKVYSHLDERSSAFFALGLALATDEPIALVCTSGSAVANYFPAIVEAHQSRVPLIVLTGDRPHELRHSGANQTIDQIKIFGDYALWFVDAPVPEANPSDVVLNYLRTTANRAYAMANGITTGNRKGVVHVNLPFRKPLEPTPEDVATLEFDITDDRKPHTQFLTIPQPQYGFEQLIVPDPNSTVRTLIVCGSRSPRYRFPEDLIAEAAWHGIPIIAEPLSGMRFHPPISLEVVIAGGYDFYADYLSHEVEAVFHFGNVPTSNAINTYLSRIKPTRRFMVSADGVWSDDKHTITGFLHSAPRPMHFAADHRRRPLRQPSMLAQQIQQYEQIVWDTIAETVETEEYFDGLVVYDVIENMPDESNLFVGNSLPIRHVEQFGRPSAKRINVYGNRGASGIDGNISTALGVGASDPNKPLVAIVGDVTFYHDMNGLLAVHRCGVPITIVLLNNNGGGIFHRLPINQFDPEFTDYFITPHGLDFSHAAKMYGLEYTVADSRESFLKAFRESVSSRTSAIIEVPTDAHEDLRQRAELMRKIQDKLRVMTP